MNVKSPNVTQPVEVQQPNQSQTQTGKSSDVKFADELQDLKNQEELVKGPKPENTQSQNVSDESIKAVEPEITNTIAINIKQKPPELSSVSEENAQNPANDIINEIPLNQMQNDLTETECQNQTVSAEQQLTNEIKLYENIEPSINEETNIHGINIDIQVNEETEIVENQTDDLLNIIPKPENETKEQILQQNDETLQNITKNENPTDEKQDITNPFFAKSDKKQPTENPQPEHNKISTALNDLNSVLNKLNQPDDKEPFSLKKAKTNTDNKNEEGEDLINNDFSIDNKDKLPQMASNMSFGGDGQPFSSFMNNNNPSREDKKLSSSAEDLAEEAAILSTMAENIAIANKTAIEEPEVKVVHKNDGIKKVDTKTNIVQETIVKYDTVVMNEADVEVFANLVENKEVDLNNMAPESAQKSIHVSKTLADMIAKSMEDNKPVRIEFDNGISVIIKISKDGKLSADFLPSTQVAEAYLRENLPVLRQKFNEQNIDYDELNQRERRNQDREQNRKKGRDDE